MEERISFMEKKQLANIFVNPTLMQQYVETHSQKRQRNDIGHKRRLTMTLSAERLLDVVSVAVHIDQLLHDPTEDLELEHMQRDIETVLFSAALDDEASGIVDLTASSIPASSSANLEPVTENIWPCSVEMKQQKYW